MNNLRLLPIVLVAASALLLLKVIGLVTEGRYSLLGTEFAQAQQVSSLLDDQIELTEQEENAARRAADALFTDAAGTSGDDSTVTVNTTTNQGEVIPLNMTDDNAVSERAVLERLSERRAALDALEAELTVRADLVAAAEARLEERMQALSAVEARVQSLMDQYDAMADEQFSSLVSMYENMKSADAAKVFNRLDIQVLLRLATSVSARKMSQILADMDAARAQELTIAMASMSITEPTVNDVPVAGADGLPQIVGQ